MNVLRKTVINKQFNVLSNIASSSLDQYFIQFCKSTVSCKSIYLMRGFHDDLTMQQNYAPFRLLNAEMKTPGYLINCSFSLFWGTAIRTGRKILSLVEKCEMDNAVQFKLNCSQTASSDLSFQKEWSVVVNITLTLILLLLLTALLSLLLCTRFSVSLLTAHWTLFANNL